MSLRSLVHNRAIAGFALLFILIAVLLVVLAQTGCLTKKTDTVYNSPVADDPYQVHHWTLENGLQVFFSQNRAQPNFYAQVVVRAGSANDPAHATGLAHYLEHMLFKGTKELGTIDYESERVHQDRVEALYYQLGQESDPERRSEILRAIDQASVAGANYVVFNELDTLLSVLGANKVNAHVWLDETVYKAEFPNNRLQAWAALESERFSDPVLRLFQWELEVVYEEKNQSLDRPGSRLWEQTLSQVWAGHPYGDQTTIGTIEHLKNPPLHEVKKFFAKYYVPGNMSLILAGDLEPEQVIQAVEEHFGQWPKAPMPDPQLDSVPPLKQQKVSELVGPGESQIFLGFQTHNSTSEQYATSLVFEKMLQTHLEELKAQQNLKEVSVFAISQYYGGFLAIVAYPLPQQSLDELRQTILDSLESFKIGEFEDGLLQGAILSAKADFEKTLESNEDRVSFLTDAYIKRQDWSSMSQLGAQLTQVSREAIAAYAQTYLTDNYSLVNYSSGPYSAPVVEKPNLTPLDSAGAPKGQHSKCFHRVVELAQQSPDIQYEPMNIESKVTQLSVIPGVEIIHTANPYNNLADLVLHWEINPLHNPSACVWLKYLEKADAENERLLELRRAFYSQGVEFSLDCSTRSLQLQLKGEEAHLMEAFERLYRFIQTAQADQELLNNVVAAEIDSRQKSMTDPNQINQIVFSYLKDQEYSHTNLTSSNQTLTSLESQKDLSRLQSQMRHSAKRVHYIGKVDARQVAQSLAEWVDPENPEAFKALAISSDSHSLPTPRSVAHNLSQNKVYVYDSPGVTQTQFHMLRDLGPLSSSDLSQYFTAEFYGYFLGSGMSSPVFKEIRERRALAYMAFARLERPYQEGDESLFRTTVGTQTDKLPEVFNVARMLIDEYPMSSQEFSQSVGSLRQTISATRPDFRTLPSRYHEMKRMGFPMDRSDLWNQFLSEFQLEDMHRFAAENLARKPFAFGIIGDRSRLDLSFLPDGYEIIDLKAEDVVNY